MNKHSLNQLAQLSLAVLAAVLLSACGSSQASGASSVVPNTSAVNAQIQRAELASNVYELAYSEKQQTVFAAAPSQAQGQQLPTHAVLRLNPQTLAVQARIELPHPGYGLALDDAGQRLYVGHGREGFISVIDTATNRLIKTLPLAPNAGKTEGKDAFAYHVRELRLDGSGKRLYAPGLGEPDSVLFVIDTEKLELIKTVSGLGFYGIGVAVDDKQGRVFVGTAYQGIKVVDAQRLEVVDTWKTETAIVYNLHYDPQTNRLLGTDGGLPDAEGQAGLRKKYPGMPLRGNESRTFILDATTGKELISLSTPKAAAPSLAVQLDSASKRLFVTNRGDKDGTVTVYDSTTYQLLQTIPLPPHPNSLAFDAKNNVMYVSVKNGKQADKESKLESVARIQF